MAEASRRTVMIIGGLLLLALFIYLIVVFYAYKNGWWIFGPYTPPPLENGWQPGGPLQQLTPEQAAARRNCLINNECSGT